MTKKKILIATGGTGGHIFPALSLAKNLIKKNYDIILTTDKRGLKYLEKRVKKYNSNIPLGINIGCNKDTINQISDYSILTKNLGEYADWITINISSPNTPGLRSIQTSDLLPNLLSTVNNERENIENKRGRSLQVWLKISPDLSDRELKNLIDISLKHNIDAICISNSTIARPYELKSKNKNENGGLSGSPLSLQSTKILAKAYLHAYNNIKFIGIGGITSADDAYIKILAGASILQLYTGLIFKPVTFTKISQASLIVYSLIPPRLIISPIHLEF